MSHFDIMPEDDGSHTLLEPPSPAYSNVTVRRAFIVWLHCGQQNEFKDVCNYYHYLETLEETLPAEKRASSRLQEFNLLSQMPPYSYYLQRLFPKLYKLNNLDYINIKQVEEVKLEDCVFNLEGFHKMKSQKGVSSKEIIKTSQVIRKYCKAHSKSLRKFLLEFQDFAKKCQIVNTVNNVVIYIKKRDITDEIETWKRLPKHFSFLDTEVSKEELVESEIDTAKNEVDEGSTYSIENNLQAPKQNNIPIMINDSRRKELMNLMPQLRSK